MMNVIGLLWSGLDHLGSHISIVNCSSRSLMSVHSGLLVSARSAPPSIIQLKIAPFVGAPPLGAPVVKLAVANSAMTGSNQVSRQLTPMKYASVTKTDPADLKSVHAGTAVSSAGALMGPSPANPAPARPEQPRLLNHSYWHHMLFLVYDAPQANKVLSMLTDGVRIGRPRASQAIVSPNWPSAREHGAKVSEVLAVDLELGRLHGPFSSPPYQAYIVSPLGAFKKRDSEKIRLIHDLSYPAQGSVNSLIDPTEFSLKYASVDDAVAFCNSFTSAPPFLAKLDLQDAFKFIYINPEDWHLMGFSWPDGEGSTQYYFSKVLSFGLRSAPALFDVFAAALLQFMTHNGAPCTIVRYVDDFLIVAPDADTCQDGLSIMLRTCDKAGFPVQPSKVSPPLHAGKILGYHN